MHFKAMKCLAVLFGVLAVLHAASIALFVTLGDASQSGFLSFIAIASLGNVSGLSANDTYWLAAVMLALNLATVIMVLYTASYLEHKAKEEEAMFDEKYQNTSAYTAECRNLPETICVDKLMAQVTEYFDSLLLPVEVRRASLTKDEENAINNEKTALSSAETCVASITEYSHQNLEDLTPFFGKNGSLHVRKRPAVY